MNRFKYVLGLIVAIPIVSWYAQHLFTDADAARNGSGTMSILHSATSGTTITSTDYNANLTDIASEITNSLPRDGQAAMSGQMKSSSGSVAAPGITFSSATDSGWYYPGSSVFAFSVAGTKIFDVDSNGINLVTGKDLKIGGVSVQSIAASSVPVGSIQAYAGLSAPSGYLLCYGQAVSRATYSNLFSAISTTYGSGDGSTTFNVPDLRGRTVFGQDDMGGSSANRLVGALTNTFDGDTLGNTGGIETFTIAQANLPNVNLSAASLAASIKFSIAHTTSSGGSADRVFEIVSTGTTTDASAVTLSGNVPLGGSGTALSNVPPGIVLNYIIYTGV